MSALSAAVIEQRLEALGITNDDGSLILDVLLAYGLPRSSVSRLRNGSLNLAKGKGDFLWKDKLFYHLEAGGSIRSLLSGYLRDRGIMRVRPRFVVVSDGRNWACCDTKTADTLDFPVAELAQRSSFFNPWAGFEKAKITLENPADIKAARKMGKLVDALRHDNPSLPPHDMNVFMARLLFCFFAEDSGIFPGGNVFTTSIKENTLRDGSDLCTHLDRIFRMMNTPENAPARRNPPFRLQAFPYVNGGLFRDVHPVPHFSMRAREAIIDAGDQDWAEINTDIFGNMFQACLDPGQRANLGEHYTSVPNIMKVLNPLFLESLQEEAEKVKGKPKDAQRFIDRLSRIRFFDPACGSGNFLIVAFKEIRKLEMDVIENTEGLLRMPSVGIHQFYGIEIDDFAHEIAVLSLWLVDHQMNLEFNERFGTNVPTLPLKANENIYCGNALRMDWETVCPKVKYSQAPLYTMNPLLQNAGPAEDDEVYVFGNPPYLGRNVRSSVQKKDMDIVFSGWKNYAALDYVACWFLKGAEYIKYSKAKCAYVSTNSITQGEQVAIFWKPVLGKIVDIGFAYTSFKWVNNAMYQAGITCVIIGMAPVGCNEQRKIYSDRDHRIVDEITPYLRRGKTTYVSPKSACISSLPSISFGNMPNDGGNLIIERDDYNSFIIENPGVGKYIRKFVGSAEYIRGEARYCLWLVSAKTSDMSRMPGVMQRVEQCRNLRLKSHRKTTQELADTPHLMGEIRHKDTDAILIPRVSSERREYIPMGYVDKDTIISDSAHAVYDAEPWVFGILTSRMHMAWVRVTCGRLKTDYRYSAKLCYNTFPLKPLTAAQKEELTAAAWGVLGTREYHTDMTMAQMYDPETMPEDLREAHHALDGVVDRLYHPEGFRDDEERLECLFKLYQEMA